jgi:hypothetical protein
MAIALRPRASASAITSRNGSHAHALGSRPGCGDRSTSAESTSRSTTPGAGGRSWASTADAAVVSKWVARTHERVQNRRVAACESPKARSAGYVDDPSS